jgi:ATP-dependent exoDNAse (exonuclease V) beta subunit
VKLLADSPDVVDRIQVAHVDRLAHRVFRQHHGAPAMLNHHQERELWSSIVQRWKLSFSEAFLAEEWRQVVIGQNITTAQEYLAAKRKGRGRPLQSAQRAQTWQAISEFVAELKARKRWTHETVCVAATKELQAQQDKPYRHIVVDEAQDLSPWQWRLLRAAVPEASDDLFIAADPHQRIYDHRVSLRDVGIAVTGRSRRLTLNYRTTAEILGWSLGLLQGEPIDDMDGSLDSIAGCRSEVHGEPPEMKGFATKANELAALANTITAWIQSGVEPGAIGVATRSNHLADEVVRALQGESIPVGALSSASTPDDAVCVGTMHRMKGLEFRCLAVVGVNEHLVPPQKAVTPIDEDETTHRYDLQRERCLLFVACTRAREKLSITWHGTTSPLISTLV